MSKKLQVFKLKPDKLLFTKLFVQEKVVAWYKIKTSENLELIVIDRRKWQWKKFLNTQVYKWMFNKLCELQKIKVLLLKMNMYYWIVVIYIYESKL